MSLTPTSKVLFGKSLPGRWVHFSNWGVSAAMPRQQAFHVRIVNQISLLALLLGSFRSLFALFLGDWMAAAMGLIATVVWIFPPWLNRIGFPNTAKLTFLGLYFFIFVFSTLISSDSNGHWGVFFVAVAATLFYTDRRTILVFGILGLLMYVACELWVQTMPSVVDIKFPIFNTISKGISIGLTFFLLSALLVRELQSSEQQARSDSERLNAIIEGALDAVISINKEGRVTGWNPQAVHIFGYTKDDALGKDLRLIIPDQYWEAHAQGMAQYFKTGHGHMLNKRIEIEGKRKNGEIFPLELAVIPVEEHGERFFSAFIRDITEAKQAQEKLLILNEELKQFASVASHDLSEPLRNIRAFSEILLEDTPQNDLAREYIGFITDATARMSNLLTDLIAFARAEGSPGAPHGVDLNQALKAARNNLTIHLHEAGAEVVAGDLPVVMGHTSAYIQLFQNLLSNALKFHQPGKKPKVDISAERQGDFWQIGFRDNGIGIPPDKVEDIFKPFKRLHNKSDIDGSGIGLSTCRKIAQRYGGRIWADPIVQEGALFLIRLPAAPES